MLAPWRVAWLALIYRECERNHHTVVLSHLDDLDSCPGEIRLATLEASRVFDALDWRLVGVLIDHPEMILPEAKALTLDGDTLRAEALLHAWGHRSRKPWAAPHRGSRWFKVERAMREFVAEGATVSRDDVDSIAQAAYTELTGTTREEYAAQSPTSSYVSPSMYDDDEPVGVGMCPSCEAEIPLDRIALHLDGLDGARPECPRQDLKLIVQRAELEQYNRPRQLWSQR